MWVCHSFESAASVHVAKIRDWSARFACQRVSLSRSKTTAAADRRKSALGPTSQQQNTSPQQQGLSLLFDC